MYSAACGSMGRSIKLRGGCIHHDNGPLGAATIARAEERRIELLKAAGYNAIRSSHNPISAAMLDACDRIGMLVMEEFTDEWTVPTNGHGYGYGVNMPEWWRRALTEMAERDYNHPSVVLYSIGNEIGDTGNRFDAIRGRDMVDHLKAIDDTRPITNAINPMMSVLRELKAQIGLEDDAGGVNSFMQWVNDSEEAFASPDISTERLEEPMSQLDVSGYNYAHGRYELDIRHPLRLLLGTEVAPNELDETWELVQRHPQILGDFSRTAWEYIGEAGISADKPAEEGFFGQWPWRLSGTVDLGITGERRTISYWRETVWGLRSTPYIAVVRPDAPDPEWLQRSLYSWSDSLSSWSWPGYEGTSTTVEVYSDADEVQLLLNGAQVGRTPAGAAHRFIARFEAAYEPGELTAAAFTGGLETGRMTIRSAGSEIRLNAVADREVIRADETDLAFVEIALSDEHGVVHVTKDTTVTVIVSGGGHLQGLARTALSSDNDYSAASCRTFRRLGLTVIRPTGVGRINVSARTESDDELNLSLQAE